MEMQEKTIYDDFAEGEEGSELTLEGFWKCGFVFVCLSMSSYSWNSVLLRGMVLLFLTSTLLCFSCCSLRWRYLAVTIAIDVSCRKASQETCPRELWIGFPQILGWWCLSLEDAAGGVGARSEAACLGGPFRLLVVYLCVLFISLFICLWRD